MFYIMIRFSFKLIQFNDAFLKILFTFFISKFIEIILLIRTKIKSSEFSVIIFVSSNVMFLINVYGTLN